MASLGPSVSSLRSSLSLLDSSISILDTGVNDFPRLCKILQTQKHFELLPETQLYAAQQSLVDEIAPAIEQLISTAEAYVNQLSRREESLKARHELLEGRLGGHKRTSSVGATTGARSSSAATRSAGSNLMPGSDRTAIAAKRLQKKKEQLQYVIGRLELQSKQKERELRKSMAFVRD